MSKPESIPEIVREATEKKQIVTRLISLHEQAKALLEKRGREVVDGEPPHRLEYTCTFPTEDLPIDVTMASLRYKGPEHKLIEESKTVFIEVGEIPTIALRSDPHGSVIRDKGIESITRSDLDACSELIKAVKNTGR